MKKSTRTHLLNILFILLISGGFIAIAFRDVDWVSFQQGLLNIHYVWLLSGGVAMVMYWLIESLVLHRMINSQTTGLHFGSSFKITMVGQLFNIITPSSTGGQPAQLYMLHKRGMDLGIASSVLILKFILFQTMLVILFIGMFAFGYRDLAASVPNMKYFVMFGFTINVAVIAVLLLVCFSKPTVFALIHFLLKPVSLFKKNNYIRWKEKLMTKVEAFHAESRRLIHHKSLLASCSFLSALQLLFFFSVPYFVFLSLGYSQLNILTVMSFHAFIMMFSSLIPTPGGSGAGEYSFTLLFGSMVIQTDLLVGLILWRVLTAYSCVLIGLLVMVIKPSRQNTNPHPEVS
ncbi:lysylphosphatidylglycerol synthase transmembrane domain-containing protein [Alkalicoccobacillus murimartini]|uniref:Phosphatidylglycerol lysyltransferase n=1 Tax=Alkalicoccobacillus murimartini TaxID=171685 RepID=A0ABT9YE66_9BACI|nr:lysylphosphatidylglycerol synthase transmembrane domain-containing protein [Alkalicoccobacillus murimartini]MDQ0206132.1 uncharacterized protein (TIRG00374 family) [Alkalicoccobacillus murimartini]